MRPIRRTLAVVAAASLLPLGLAGAAQAAPARPALPLIAAAPTPQGPLASTACIGAGTVTCDLWAHAGTVAMPGIATPVPVWGFTSAAATPPTPTGPVLVVTQGDTVTITVHNGLDSALSLAVPNMTGTAPDTVGAAAGGTKAYTFTAGRPGTYLYEAGHTPDGARQAAMGLVGALVVRPTTAGTAYGTPASAFDDEAALVLSEIDPAFNAAPTTFDLRNFHPTLKLINGKAFPETDPIATAVGHKVLLRYVNAGSVDHAMGVAGTRQTIVGADARPNADAFPLFADTIPPGQTEDAIVGAPATIDGAKFVVYETAGRLDNIGARVGTTTGVAFGGMMTYLTTDAVAPTTDTFGPVSGNVKLTPASVKATQPVTLTADLSDAANGNSAVTRAEYVIDDPGTVAVGSGTPLTGGFPAPVVTGATATITPAVLQTLSQGTHTVYVRALDAAGNWGPVGSATFALTVTGPTTTAVVVNPAVTNGTADVALSATGDDTGLGGTVVAAEYFIGNPGAASGTGTAMTLTAGTVAAETATIPAATVAALAAGPVPVYVHSKDSFGLWGPQVPVTLTVNKTGPTASGLIIDPNPTDGTVGSKVDPTQIQVKGTFTEVGNPVVSPIAGAEGFLDTSGANGTGFVFVAADGRFDTATETAYGLIPLSQVTGLANGAHTIYVHAKDAAGNWGALSTVTLTVDRGVVVSGLTATITPASPTVVATTTAVTLAATATSPNGAPQGAEWFVDADPGAGLGRPVQITPGAPGTYALAASVPPGGLTVGTHTISVRAKSPAGTWGRPVFVTVNVTAASTLLFADGFESGSTANWAGQTGVLSVVAPGAGGTARQLSVPAAGTAAVQVVDTTPIAEPTYTASFAFTAGTVTAGTNGTVNLFQAVTAANGEVFTVQYQKQGTANYRVRLVRGGSSSPWIAVTGTGVQTLTVHWSTTPTAGTATLRVGAGAPVTLAGNSRAVGALRVDTVRMGLSGGPAATTGTALFDTFTSTRN